jgi:hypothetical protein
LDLTSTRVDIMQTGAGALYLATNVEV